MVWRNRNYKSGRKKAAQVLPDRNHAPQQTSGAGPNMRSIQRRGRCFRALSFNSPLHPYGKMPDVPCPECMARERGILRRRSSSFEPPRGRPRLSGSAQHQALAARSRNQWAGCRLPVLAVGGAGSCHIAMGVWAGGRRRGYRLEPAHRVFCAEVLSQPPNPLRQLGPHLVGRIRVEQQGAGKFARKGGASVETRQSLWEEQFQSGLLLDHFEAPLKHFHPPSLPPRVNSVIQG